MRCNYACLLTTTHYVSTGNVPACNACKCVRWAAGLCRMATRPAGSTTAVVCMYDGFNFGSTPYDVSELEFMFAPYLWAMDLWY